MFVKNCRYCAGRDYELSQGRNARELDKIAASNQV